MTDEQAIDNAFEEMEKELLAAAIEIAEADELHLTDGRIIKKPINQEIATIK